ncbi:hypothetical protein HOLleu_13074 [Holothuria leucospilota]|uniref:Uncharacterized protein n=1 Tax=Holothuria leucospilota TaxID=206669 RepID=A0A9Q1CB92_HOLLE|nr:hypothetical protein HOLleu_13074 [Holothuria leucospilota]
MPYIERKNPIVFGGGQRSPGVTGGQTLKTLLTQYLEWRSNVIWGHQRSMSENLVKTISPDWCRILPTGSVNGGGGCHTPTPPLATALGVTAQIVNTMLQ